MLYISVLNTEILFCKNRTQNNNLKSLIVYNGGILKINLICFLTVAHVLFLIFFPS